MFFDRFDGSLTPSPVTPGAEGLYYNRNRHYAPVLGRFLQRDPNETGQETLGLFYDGQAPSIASDGFNLNGVYGDGLSLFAYLDSNPVNGLDPTGLFGHTFDDEIDAVIADIIGTRVANLASVKASIGITINIAAQIAQLSLSMLPGGDAVLLAGRLASGGSFSDGDVINGVLSLAGAVLVARIVGKTFSALRRVKNARKIQRIRFGQRGVSRAFRNGKFAGRSIDDVVAGLRSGAIKPDQLPIEVIIRDGVQYTLNNRSLRALRAAGLEPTIVKNVTGQIAAERRLTSRLAEIGGQVLEDFLPPIR